MKSLLILLLIPFVCFAEDRTNIILDKKIEIFCKRYKLADELNFGKFGRSNGDRCKLILQAIYRFETGNLKSYTGNNIFNFRSPNCKQEWINKYSCKIKNGFLIFPDKTNGIKFAVYRYYKYDYRKTISQIIGGGCYYNLNNKYVCFSGYTHTKKDVPNYIKYVKDYFNKNK